MTPELAGQRVLRPRTRRVHRRQERPRGRVRASPRRHAIPRRDRRAAAGLAGAAAARCAGGQPVQTCWREHLAAHQVSSSVGHTPQSGSVHGRGTFPSRPVPTASPVRCAAPRRYASARRTCSPLARHFQADVQDEDGPDGFDEPVCQYLFRRDYPGNVRELKRVVERLCLRHAGSGPFDRRRAERRAAD